MAGPDAQDRPAPAATLRDLRRFHLGDGPATPLPAGALPALLAPFRQPHRLRHDFPLVLDGDLRCRPLTDLLQIADTEDRVLRDNLPRLEQYARALVGDGQAADPATLVQKAGERMLHELDLPEGAGATAKTNLMALVRSLPAGRLLGLTPETPMDLLRAAARQRLAAARAPFRARVEELAAGVRRLLQVAASKDPSARQPEALQKTLGSAASRFLDPAALARAIGPHRGSGPGGPEQQQRRERLQTTLAALERHLQEDAAEAVEAIVAVRDEPDPCEAAAAAFDREAERLADVVGAVRVAELELRSAYEPARHDPLLAALSWRDCSPEELHVLPTVVAAMTAEDLARGGLPSLSRLLLSGRPVQVLVLQSPARDPAAVFRMELAYLAVAHREAFVQQSTAARPTHLLEGFRRALAGSRAAVHVVDSGFDGTGKVPLLGAFLHAGAAIEGRAHPLFHYDPEAGETWARRFDFDHNPQPDADWPRARRTMAAPEGDGDQREQELVFTYADFALLEPAYGDQFSLLPNDLQSDDLIPLDQHLELDPEGATRRVPFVWIVDPENNLHRAAVRRPLLVACRDRLRFWRTLQELGGVRNEHVREAVQRARQEAAEQSQRELQAEQARHQARLEAVRQEAVAQAMQNLSRMLLELDPLATAPATVPVAPNREDEPVAPSEATEVQEPEAAAAEAAPEAKAPAAAEEAEDLDEAWIESTRCSSCNDCININPLLFVYDENKQARIGDLSKGTFAQLVQAAEKCPVRCIHPGKPRNPDEPNLEELVARAEAYQ